MVRVHCAYNTSARGAEFIFGRREEDKRNGWEVGLMQRQGMFYLAYLAGDWGAPLVGDFKELQNKELREPYKTTSSEPSKRATHSPKAGAAPSIRVEKANASRRAYLFASTLPSG